MSNYYDDATGSGWQMNGSDWNVMGSDIQANNAKVSYDDAATVALNTGSLITQDSLLSLHTGSIATNTAKISYDDAVAVGSNTAHRTSDGSDHGFIDQDVTSGATPTFTNTNFTESTNKRYMTDVQENNLDNQSGINTGDKADSAINHDVLLNVHQNVNTAASPTFAAVTGGKVTVDNSTTNNGLFIDQLGNGIACNLVNSGTDHGLYISQDGVQAASRYALNVYSNAIQTNTQLANIWLDNASSTVDALSVRNDGSGAAINVIGNIAVSGTVDGVDVGSEATRLANTSGSNSGDQTISDATISITDITTNNVSPLAHGFAPKSNGTATTYLDGTGSYSTPPAGGGDLWSDPVNSNIVPDGDITRNLGDSTHRFNDLYIERMVSTDGTDSFETFVGQFRIKTNNIVRWSVTDNGLELGNTGARVTTIYDTDLMTENSATALATQQSIKAYVDANAGGISNIVEDTTPQLGGELDAGAHSIGFTLQTATGDGATTIDWKLGNKFKFTFGAFNETFTFTNPSKPCSVQIIMVQDSVGSRTATWPASVKWAGGTAPTLTTTPTTGTDIVTLTFDGTNYYGGASLDFS